MPELPDVIAYIEALRPKIVGRPIERVRVISPFFVRSVEPALDEVAGRRVLELRRIGKRIVFVAVSSPGGRANVARVFKPWRGPPSHPRPEGGRSSPKDIPFVADVLGGGQSSFALPGENAIEHTHQGFEKPWLRPCALRAKDREIDAPPG